MFSCRGRLSSSSGSTPLRWQSRTYQTIMNYGLEREEEYSQSAYAVFDLMARYEITENLSAQLNANNVTDEKYFDIFDAFGALTYGAPRSLTASAKYRF